MITKPIYPPPYDNLTGIIWRRIYRLGYYMEEDIQVRLSYGGGYTG